MNRYSRASEDRLASVDPGMALIFRTVLPLVDHTIICGYRDAEDQAAAYKSGKSQVKFPNSKHNRLPSLAVDAAPFDRDIRNIDWDDFQSMCLFAGVVKGVAYMLKQQGMIDFDIRWGGDWDSDWNTDDERFRDYVHFEKVYT